MHALVALLIVASLRPAHQEVIDDILESLSKGVNFFEQQSRNMNLDGVVGYVILQAQLQQATKSQTHSDSLNLSQRSIAVSLVKKLDKSLALAVASLQQTDPKYYKDGSTRLHAQSQGAPKIKSQFPKDFVMCDIELCNWCYSDHKGRRFDTIAENQRESQKELDTFLGHVPEVAGMLGVLYCGAREFEPVLSASFWSLPNEWISTDPSLAYSTPRSVECYDEQLGDKCMTLLLGTWKDDGTPCIVTKACRDTMTRFGCPHYSLSHQLLYFMIGTMKGCARMLKGELRLSRVNITVEHYQKIFCSNMMKSNQEMSIKGLTWQIQDIFMENILLCGLAGFSDFYKAAWLQQILAWQDKDLGCFGKDDDYSQMFEEFLDAAHKRVKRREKTLKDGCSSHTTGVAMSALGGYINFYLSEQDITKRPLV
ncbi:UPF0764 protein C16orf89-like precursor [Silurus asotus]|uniref:UPF0764 protein C16orf89-like n=1 Tax=Silurus asotus TaxID=30991 RepID=A0AAD5FP89_SILAS|nr:UPF0764 protein C16orf89-like precursor [Silurus asotus]